MSHAFSFHFSWSASGRPRQMTIVDLEATCPTCGYDEIQRFYHGIPLHELTLARFRKLPQEVVRLSGYECSNCGTSVQPPSRTRGTVVFAFVGGEGIVRTFFDVRDPQPVHLRYAFEPGARLDVQALPLLDAEPLAATVGLREQLVEEELHRAFDRRFNLKAAWRAMLLGTLPPMSRVAPGVIANISHEAEQEYSDVRDPIDVHCAALDALWPLDVLTPPPPFKAGLAPERSPGHPGEWLPETHSSQVYSGKIKLTALLSPEIARQTFVETLEAARLSVTFDGHRFSRITTPRDTLYEREIDLRTILARAAWTALTPAEAARLTAEEIVAELMGLSLT